MTVICPPNSESVIPVDLEYVHYTWGDGDSLDRERVRDILLEEYNYKYVPDQSQLTGNMSNMKWVSQYA